MKVILPGKGPKRALLDIMRAVESQVHLFRKDCWNITTELLADYLGIIENPWKYSLPDTKYEGPPNKWTFHDFQKVKAAVPKSLIEAYVTEAKAEPWDHLGDIFTEEELAGRKNRLGQCLTPRQIVEFMVSMTLGNETEKLYPYVKPDLPTRIWLTHEALAFNDRLAGISINLQAERARWHTVIGMRPLLVKYDPEPITDLDPATGTGRFLIAASQTYPEKPLLLFGVEIDVWLYRACLVNMALFSKHPYFIICGDTLKLGVQGPANEQLWNLSNRWTPPDLSDFYYKPKPPFKFSLKDYQPPDRTEEPTEPTPTRRTPVFSLAQYRKT